MNKIEPKKRESRLLRWFGILLITLVLLGTGGVFLCRYTPRAYQPPPVNNPEQVSPYLTHKLGPDFVNQVQLDKPFELLVEQEGLNDIINRQSWVEQFDDFAFTDPVVLFDLNTIYLMGTLDYKGISSVLTIIAFPQMDSQGTVSLNIQSIRLGVVPVTKLVSYLARKGFEQSRECFEDDPQLAEIVRAVVHNEPFEPVFKISDRMVRIAQITILPKKLILKFKPE
ncbi:MAG: hypothetical protein ISS71_06225 [Phycisphaerae bacterium]|nr:hypothetical protein [Phycisphaerae bacterium]